MWISFGEKLINFKYVGIIWADVRDDIIRLVVTSNHGGLRVEESFDTLDDLNARKKEIENILTYKGFEYGRESIGKNRSPIDQGFKIAGTDSGI